MNFDQLLLNGQVAEALELRLETLEQQACEYRVDVDLAKGSALAVAVVSVPLSLTPIGMIGAFVGLCSYGYSVWADAARTRKLYPLPGVRLSMGELFATAVREGHDGETEESLIGEITGFLDKAESLEYRAIAQYGDYIAPLLTACPAEHRPMAYRHLKRQIKLKGMLPAPSDFQQQVKALATPAPAIAAPVPSPTIGNNTRLGAIEVEHQQVDDSNPFGELPTVAPVAAPSVHVPVSIHNHLGDASKPTPKTASPAQSDRRVEPPDLTLYSDPRERMQILLRAMAESGFPLGGLLHVPFVWAWGRSQSGKSTFAHLLAIARLAMGYKVSYYSTDEDFPRSLQWTDAQDSPEGYSIALDEICETISSADKGSLAGNAWVFDEVYAAFKEHGIDVNRLLGCFLMKLAKTKASAICISQVDTSTAHGLKGLDDAWRSERISIQAHHQQDSLGNRSPMGQYTVDKGDEGTEQWFIPEWMLSDLDEWGMPNPVTWVLNRFPELGKSGKTPAPMEQAIAAPKSSNPILQNLPDELMNVVRYCADREWVTPSEVQSNCRQLREQTSAQISDFFQVLKTLNLGTVRETQRSVQFRLSDGVREAVMSE